MLNSLPEKLIRSLQNVKGFNEEAFKAVHQSGEQIVSIRVNPAKSGQRATLNEQQEEIPWSSNGHYLPQRPSFTLDPLFHAGAYYVQEASSMFLEEALKQCVDISKPLRVLDLCAAPGGKSTLIQSIISKESLLVSNEVIKTRVNILAENITKWGAANVIVTNNDPRDFQRLRNYFDVIVVDAPCSGSGLFRKDAKAISEWSEDNVQHCALRQQRIMADIMPSLKAGGVLVYSTCSYSETEDEAIADWLIEQFAVSSLQLAIETEWGIVETVSEKKKAFGYRFYPDKVKGEGFFVAAFKKISEDADEKTDTGNQKVKQKKESEKLPANDIEVLKSFLQNKDGFFFIKQNEEVIAIPAYIEEDLRLIQSSLYLKKAGVKMGAIIRGELIPAHDLAVSTIINADLPKLEVDKETALQYLRKQEFKIDTDLKGWVLLSHEQMAIGWIKIMANRINNYYPKEWRILNK